MEMLRVLPSGPTTLPTSTVFPPATYPLAKGVPQPVEQFAQGACCGAGNAGFGGMIRTTVFAPPSLTVLLKPVLM